MSASVSPALFNALFQSILCVGDVGIHAHYLSIEAIVCRTEAFLSLTTVQTDECISISEKVEK